MLRTAVLTTAVTTAVLGATLLAPTTATAAVETCHGRSATVEGSPQTERLVGTEGPDVIVTNGSPYVAALGGDDVVCVTGSAFRPQVDAGDGDDLVDASALTRSGASVQLGAGSDHFVGGPQVDAVWGGTQSGLRQVDGERDVIETGPAAGTGILDRDGVHSGEAGKPNADVVRMAYGGVTWAGIPADGVLLEGGAGSELDLDLAGTDEVALDTTAGTMDVAGRPRLPFTGFTDFYVFARDGVASFDFAGSDRDERLVMEFWDASPHTVDMGAGDDVAKYYSYGRRAAAGSSYTGGPGRDELELTLPDEVDVDLDLRRGRLSLGPRRNEVTVPATGFEDATVMAEHVEVVGTGGRNDIAVYACRSRVEGRAGKDRLTAFDSVMDEKLRCKGVRATFLGGRGNDVLEGTRGRDRLLGGPGRDRADGRTGRDTCQAEKTRRCEVRR